MIQLVVQSKCVEMVWVCGEKCEKDNKSRYEWRPGGRLRGRPQMRWMTNLKGAINERSVTFHSRTAKDTHPILRDTIIKLTKQKCYQ